MMKPIFGYLSILTNQFKEMDGWICLVAAQDQKVEEYWMRPDDSLLKAERWVKERNAEQKNVWASWALFSRKERKKVAMIVSAAFVADWDDKNPEPRFIEGLKPSLTVSTSEGRWQHVYVHKPLGLDEADRAYKSLARSFGCDIGPSGDPVHPWRVPGTINWLNEKKRNEGRKPEPSTWTVCRVKELADVTPWIEARDATQNNVGDWPERHKGKPMDRVWKNRYASEHVGDASNEWNYLVLKMAEQKWGWADIAEKMEPWAERHLPRYKNQNRVEQEVLRPIEKSGIEPPENKSTQGFDAVGFRKIEKVIETDDFVQGLLMEGSSVVVYGESNSGKTFWAIDLALHVAAGKRWNNKRTTQGGVLYCALEGGIGFRNRVAAWREVNDPKGDVLFSAVMSPMDLWSEESDTDKLINTVKSQPFPVKLIVIDTLARAMSGGNENLAEDMGALVACMDKIRAATGACVMFIHHSGKDPAKGARGSNALRAAVDTEILVTASPDGTTHKATSVKQRDLGKGQEIEFRLPVHVLGKNKYGEDVTTCTVAELTPPEEMGKLRPSEEVFHGPLKEAIHEYPVAGTKNTTTETDWLEMSLAAGVVKDRDRASRQRLAGAKFAMRKAGWIEVNPDTGHITNLKH